MEETKIKRNAFLKDFQELLEKHNATLTACSCLNDNGTPYDVILCALSNDEIAWATDDDIRLSADNVFDYEE